MEATFDALLTQMEQQGFAVMDEFIDRASVAKLREHAQRAMADRAFHPAGIGQGQHHHTNHTIRNDQVLWLTPDTLAVWCPTLHHHIDHLTGWLNQSCYAGINQSEFHLAHYAPGAYYKRHLDRFANNNERRFTVIVYLNDQWCEADGGQLVVYGHAGHHSIQPEAGRLVFFPSDKLEHEVLPAKRPRWSFTGWLKTVRIPQSCCSTNY
ncbi:SM-20-related protein [Breznakibacter xylanolyticus]|uniref:SM-20-related protein n=1 Tax=Breznakibacter xylanolyticus TaxID=990 RepID=A0A2W7PAE9_9BACT|nr:2OG-Fe(II) oxygenase [Breznakibacter xylanolyticus]PZX20322.1 SM-20-related protein [Breznakibacter xylanolyticus]